MTRPSKKIPEQKLKIVLAVLRGELNAVEAGRRNGVSEQAVHNWRRTFLEAGPGGAGEGARRARSRELELEAETRS